MSDQGIFDELVAAANRIDLGSNSPGNSPSIVAGFGVPTSAEATGSVYYRKDAPNASLMLYVRSAGAWSPISSANPFVGISVGTEATLTAFDVTAVPDGAEAYVQSHRSYWTLRTQAFALRANELIASNDGARQWIREPTAHLDWALQYAPNVFVDPAAGDNQNDGLTNVTALLNMEEVARRVPTLVQAIVVNYNGVGNPATIPAWNPNVRWLSAVSATVPSITINGVETVVALPVGANGIVATATNGTAATNTPPRLTDTGGAGIVWVVGTMLRSAGGAFAVILKDEGGGVARTSFWCDSTGAVVAAPAGGVAYTAISFTVLPDLMVVSSITINVTKCRFTRWTTMESALPGGPFYALTFCDLPSTVTFLVPAAGVGLSVISSKVFSGQPFASAGSRLALLSCGVSISGGGAITAGSDGRMTVQTSVMQGNSVAATYDTESRGGGTLLLTNVAIFDSPTLPAVGVERGGYCFVRTSLWGSGNAVQGTRVRAGGRMQVKTGVIPTLAAVGQELELENAATAIQCIAGIPTAPAVPLTTWANWNAAVNPGVSGFARNVVSYLTGASVIDSA